MLLVSRRGHSNCINGPINLCDCIGGQIDMEIFIFDIKTSQFRIWAGIPRMNDLEGHRNWILIESLNQRLHFTHLFTIWQGIICIGNCHSNILEIIYQKIWKSPLIWIVQISSISHNNSTNVPLKSISWANTMQIPHTIGNIQIELIYLHLPQPESPAQSLLDSDENNVRL